MLRKILGLTGFTMVFTMQQVVFASAYEDIGLFQIVLKSIFYLGILIAVIFASLYGSRLIAKNYRSYASSRYIDLLDSINIPGGNKIIIIRISKKIYILSLSSNGSNLIDTVEEEEFFSEDFDDYLARYSKENQRKNWSIKADLLDKIKLLKDREDKNEK